MLELNKRNIALGIILLVVVYFVADMYVSSSQEVEQTPQVENQVASVGVPVSLGNISFTVKSVEELAEYNGKKTSGKFLVFVVEATNNGNDAVKIGNEQFLLIDEQERKFENNSLNDISFGSEYSAFSLMDDINPGMSKIGRISFEMPKDAVPLALAIRDNVFDFGGAKYVYVKLTQ